MTLAYSFLLKRKMLVDCADAGGAVHPAHRRRRRRGGHRGRSFWLLAFSLFVFLSLALVKRYSELRTLLAPAAATSAHGRDYVAADLPLVADAGHRLRLRVPCCVLALYINGETVLTRLYQHPSMHLADGADPCCTGSAACG